MILLPNYAYPNPPCQLSLWEEIGAPGENPRLSAKRWQTLFTWVHAWVQSGTWTCNPRGEGRFLWRLCHQSPIAWDGLDQIPRLNSSLVIDSTRLKPVTQLDSSEATDSTRSETEMTRFDSWLDLWVTRLVTWLDSWLDSTRDLTRLVTHPVGDSLQHCRHLWGTFKSKLAAYFTIPQIVN